MDTFKKPRDQFVDYVLEGLVSSGKKHTGPYQQPSYPDPPRQGSHFAPPSLRFRAWSLPSTTSQLDTTQREGTGPGLPPPPPAGLQEQGGRDGGEHPGGSQGLEGQHQAHLMLSSGRVLWTCTSHMGQYLLVSR